MSYRRHKMMADVGMQEIQYIETNGIDNIYIDTGIIPVQATDAMELLIRPIDPTFKQERFVWASCVQIYLNASMFLSYSVGTAPNYVQQGQGIGNNNNNYIYYIKLDYVNKKFESYRYGEANSNYKVSNITANPKTTQEDNSLRLLWYAGQASIPKAALYSFKYYRNGELIFDGIPVKLKGVGYLYDKINDTLYGKVGNGELICGPKVRKTT